MEKKKEIIVTISLRNKVKNILASEIENLPVLLEELPPKERINFVCKLLPYIFPKVQTVHFSEGEPFTFD